MSKTYNPSSLAAGGDSPAALHISVLSMVRSSLMRTRCVVLCVRLFMLRKTERLETNTIRPKVKNTGFIVAVTRLPATETCSARSKPNVLTNILQFGVLKKRSATIKNGKHKKRAWHRAETFLRAQHSRGLQVSNCNLASTTCP